MRDIILENLPIEEIGKIVPSTPPGEFIANYEEIPDKIKSASASCLYFIRHKKVIGNIIGDNYFPLNQAALLPNFKSPFGGKS